MKQYTTNNGKQIQVRNRLVIGRNPNLSSELQPEVERQPMWQIGRKFWWKANRTDNPSQNVPLQLEIVCDLSNGATEWPQAIIRQHHF